MGLLDLFKKNKEETKNKSVTLLKTLKGETPSYSTFGDDIEKDETVYSISRRIINEYSKLNPSHIKKVCGKQVVVNNTHISSLLKFPNKKEHMNDFLKKASYMWLFYDNAFIYPIYDLYVNKINGHQKKFYKEIVVLQPQRVDFFEDDKGEIFVEFTFAKGYKSGKLAYNDIVHWRRDYGANEIMGGNERGIPNNSSLLKHLELNNQLLESTVHTVNGSLQINGVLKYQGLVKEEEKERTRLQFVEDLKNNESGIISLDSGADYISIPFNGKVIDKETLQFLDDKTRKHYGVSEAILNGDYTAEQKEAFYETVLEEGIIGLGLAFTRVMFTPFERSNGNEIIFYSNKIQMMSHDKKIQLANLLMPVGGVTPNQVLSWFGQAPYEGGDRRYRFLNWIPEDIADAYQLETYKKSNEGNEQPKPNDDVQNFTK